MGGVLGGSRQAKDDALVLSKQPTLAKKRLSSLRRPFGGSSNKSAAGGGDEPGNSEERTTTLAASRSDPDEVAADDSKDEASAAMSKETAEERRNDSHEEGKESEPSPPLSRVSVKKVVVEEPPPPPPDPIGEGGYLMFTTVSEGTLTCHFSHTRMEGAIMYFKPKRIVPAFKFRQNSGRIEIVRKLMQHQQLYYEGVAQFIKMGREFDSDFVLLDPGRVRIYRLFDVSSVAAVETGTFFPSSSFTSIACVPQGNTDYAGVRTMSKDNFQATANKTGRALNF